MSIKQLLALLGYVGWSALCTHWYCCWMQVACESCGAEAYAAYHAPPVEPIATTTAAVPLAYDWAKTLEWTKVRSSSASLLLISIESILQGAFLYPRENKFDYEGDKNQVRGFFSV